MDNIDIKILFLLFEKKNTKTYIPNKKNVHKFL